jgi:hypothetical protein
MIARLLGLAAATAAIALTTHAGLLWLLLWSGSILAVTTKVTSKSQATEKRVDRVAAQIGTVVQTLSGTVTTTSGLANGQITGFCSTNGLPNGQITGTCDDSGIADGTFSGNTGTSTAGPVAHTHPFSGAIASGHHTHTAGNYAVIDGNHNHGSGNYAVVDGTHHHNLPNVN